MDGAGLHGRRPRPVADAPTVDAAAVAKAWLLALVADAPLAQAGLVPAAELARNGPELCAGILAALASDAALDRLLAAGDGRSQASAAARMTGARTPAALAEGVEALRGATWRALRAELRDGPIELVAELGDRLAFVCARVAAAALTAPGAESPGRAGPLAHALAGAPPVPADDGEGEEPPTPAPPGGVHVVDLPSAGREELDPLSSLARELADAAPGGVLAPEAPFVPAADTATVTRVPLDTSWAEQAQAGPPWLAAIERRLERRTQDGLSFAVLVVEIDDLDRLMAAESGREVGLALETAERGLTAELAPADLVVRERLGRWWLTSPDRDLESARDLGLRVAGAIAGAALAGAPLKASIGVAVCPDDGESLESLAGEADEAMFAARAAGRPLA